MIFYDSHKWRTMIRLHGSVFPRASRCGLPSALLALGLKYLEKEGYIDFSSLTMLNEGSIYSGFVFVLGFSLVFRTSQSYARYWTAATCLHEMGSEWSDACASIIAFSRNSQQPAAEIDKFAHTVVRLFSLLHASALEEICSMENENFPLIDVQGFCKKDLAFLAREDTQGKKMNIILCWIKVYIIQGLQIGLLNVPAPILTRVFQEFGSGVINYHKAQQVVIWPFPFPYTQLNLMLLYIYMIITPLVTCIWDAQPWLCSIFTFISVVCMCGLDLIASELENPFGDDPNDLPGMEMQDNFNKGLLVMLNPMTWKPPQLVPAHLDHKALATQATCERIPMPVFKTDSLKNRGDKVNGQLSWANHSFPSSELRRVHRWLRLSDRDSDPPEASNPSTDPAEGLGYGSESKEALPSYRSLPPSSSSSLGLAGALRHDREAIHAAAQPWVDFHQAVSKELQEHLRRQLQHHEAVLQRQLTSQTQAVSAWSGTLTRSRIDEEDEEPWRDVDCQGEESRSEEEGEQLPSPPQEHPVPEGPTPRGRALEGKEPARRRLTSRSNFGMEAVRRTALGVAHSRARKLPNPVSSV